MSLFKMFGGGRSKGDKAEISRDQGSEITPKRSAQTPQVAAEDGQGVVDPDEAEARAAAAQLDLPFRSGKKSRNLSISRSGRHKYKNNNRANIVTGEVFNASSSESTPNGTGSAANGSYCRTPSDYRDSKASHGGTIVQAHTPMARTPTAV